MAQIHRALLLTMTLFIGFPLINTRLFAMRPLNARQVYRLLQESGRADAIPQGRVITQGLAAMTGFALGLTKGLGSALLFDIITANVTDLDLNGGSSNSNSAGNTLTTQEICFNSRNARSFEDAEAIAEAYSRDDNKEDQNKVRHSDVERRVTPSRHKKRKSHRRRKPGRLILKKPSLERVIASQVADATNTEVTNPTTTGMVTAQTNPGVATTGSGTNIDNGAGTGTTSTSTTSTGNEGAINCIVIQKPAGR